jgi:hypothetical protein
MLACIRVAVLPPSGSVAKLAVMVGALDPVPLLPLVQLALLRSLE